MPDEKDDKLDLARKLDALPAMIGRWLRRNAPAAARGRPDVPIGASGRSLPRARLGPSREQDERGTPANDFARVGVARPDASRVAPTYGGTADPSRSNGTLLGDTRGLLNAAGAFVPVLGKVGGVLGAVEQKIHQVQTLVSAFRQWHGTVKNLLGPDREERGVMREGAEKANVSRVGPLDAIAPDRPEGATRGEKVPTFPVDSRLAKSPRRPPHRPILDALPADDVPARTPRPPAPRPVMDALPAEHRFDPGVEPAFEVQPPGVPLPANLPRVAPPAAEHPRDDTRHDREDTPAFETAPSTLPTPPARTSVPASATTALTQGTGEPVPASEMVPPVSPARGSEPPPPEPALPSIPATPLKPHRRPRRASMGELAKSLFTPPAGSPAERARVPARIPRVEEGPRANAPPPPESSASEPPGVRPVAGEKGGDSPPPPKSPARRSAAASIPKALEYQKGEPSEDPTTRTPPPAGPSRLPSRPARRPGAVPFTGRSLPSHRPNTPGVTEASPSGEADARPATMPPARPGDVPPGPSPLPKSPARRSAAASIPEAIEYQKGEPSGEDAPDATEPPRLPTAPTRLRPQSVPFAWTTPRLARMAAGKGAGSSPPTDAGDEPPDDAPPAGTAVPAPPRGPVPVLSRKSALPSRRSAAASLPMALRHRRDEDGEEDHAAPAARSLSSALSSLRPRPSSDAGSAIGAGGSAAHHSPLGALGSVLGMFGGATGGAKSGGGGDDKALAEAIKELVEFLKARGGQGEAKSPVAGAMGMLQQQGGRQVQRGTAAGGLLGAVAGAGQQQRRGSSGDTEGLKWSRRAGAFAGEFAKTIAVGS